MSFADTPPSLLQFTVEFRSFGRDRTRVKWGYEVLMGWNFNAIYSGFAILLMLFQLPLTCPTALKGVLPLGLEKWSLVFRVLLFSEYFQFFIGIFLLCRIFFKFFPPAKICSCMLFRETATAPLSWASACQAGTWQPPILIDEAT